jgi:hypothetical protein
MGYTLKRLKAYRAEIVNGRGKCVGECTRGSYNLWYWVTWSKEAEINGCVGPYKTLADAFNNFVLANSKKAMKMRTIMFANSTTDSHSDVERVCSTASVKDPIRTISSPKERRYHNKAKQ